ncbi:hypothetical protein [Granulicella arctica]|uniref:Uncharacterized protein n=1 Tax=Granulicella arctica TaxID=940613 RepID=A0A7Y9PEC6_9BACT|nr:hypothetical protein [Granulicella arctica]NYF78319.1 hypothetical protein [Granulicella arctica]
MKLHLVRALLLACILPSMAIFAQTPAAAAAPSLPAVLTALEATKILPPSVFFRGLSAPIQGRNSAGVRFANKNLMLVTLVDTSGYSTQVQEKYQAYLITESPLDIDGHRLLPGAYGCGFIADNIFIVQDLGAHDLFTAHSVRDTALRRPTPLQIVPAPGNAGSYQLYGGRSYVTFREAGK